MHIKTMNSSFLYSRNRKHALYRSAQLTKNFCLNYLTGTPKYMYPGNYNFNFYRNGIFIIEFILYIYSYKILL